MYTLNLERSAVAILERVGLIDTAAVPRPLPWRHIPSTRITAGEVGGSSIWGRGKRGKWGRQLSRRGMLHA
jgi:methylenetetrahydrofolate reductase (NADPH)